jgi:glucosyl-3-phosphoglycerate synthase
MGRAAVRLDAMEWFGRRTFHFSQFEPVGDLVARKGDTRVSVVLPALDEQRTVGPMIQTLRSALMEQVPLIDELVVIDPGSTDRTAEIARDAGAVVVREADILPELGRVAGKGEALWKSLYATTGDIVCWLDADIEEFHPSFVYGLLGPLLTDPTVHYVKAFYERPLADRGRLHPTGGGRVTELVARPLINLHWPALAGMIQPLSGEYAGRRAVLEQVPFVSGYGVELGLLVDLLDLVGLDGLAQVDMERRIHRHQDYHALARMAFVLQQTALSRLQRSGRLVLSEPPSTTLLQFKNQLRDYRVESYEASVTERPPMASIRAISLPDPQGPKLDSHSLPQGRE